MAGIKVVEFKKSDGDVRYQIKKAWNFFKLQENPFVKYIGWTGKILGHEKEEIQETILKNEIYDLFVQTKFFLYNLDFLEINNFSKNLEKSVLDLKYFDNGKIVLNGSEKNILSTNRFLRRRYRMHYTHGDNFIILNQ